jgi:hypothetical protein
MKKLAWFLLCIALISGAVLAKSQNVGTNDAAPRTKKQKRHHKRHHHKNPHKGHLDNDRYPQPYQGR